MVAFLILEILISMFVFGFTYNFISDARDSVISVFSTIGVLSPEYYDADTIWGFDFLNLLLSFSVMFFVIGIMWYAKQKAQRQEVQWQ